MSNRITAVYEKGVFRPIEPVTLAEGSRVELQIETPPAPNPDPQKLAQALAEIAALPLQSPNDGFSGADHDKLLYGGEDAL